MSHYVRFTEYMTNDTILEPQSKKYLTKPHCALCSNVFTEDPFGMFIVSHSCKDPRTDHRYYFPICHLVCKGCYRHVDDYINDDVKCDINKLSIPEWSNARLFFTNCHFAPSATCLVNDIDTLRDVLIYINQRTDCFEEYYYVGGDPTEEI